MVESLLARGQKARDAMGAILGYVGNIDMAQLLLDHGADVNEVNEYGDSVLRYAMTYYRSKVLDFLKAHGAVLDSNMTTDGRRMWTCIARDKGNLPY